MQRDLFPVLQAADAIGRHLLHCNINVYKAVDWAVSHTLKLQCISWTSPRTKYLSFRSCRAWFEDSSRDGQDERISDKGKHRIIDVTTERSSGCQYLSVSRTRTEITPGSRIETLPRPVNFSLKLKCMETGGLQLQRLRCIGSVNYSVSENKAKILKWHKDRNIWDDLHCNFSVYGALRYMETYSNFNLLVPTNEIGISRFIRAGSDNTLYN